MSDVLRKLAFLVCMILAACAVRAPEAEGFLDPGFSKACCPAAPSSESLYATSLPSTKPLVPSKTASWTPTLTKSAVKRTAMQVARSTPTPAGSFADIQIFTPAEGSQVISPIFLQSKLNGLVEGAYRVELFSQDGRLLYRQVWGVPPAPVQGIFLDLPILFQIPAEVEDARLVVTRLDAENRLQAIESVDLQLKSSGISQVKENTWPQAAIQILSPLEGAQIMDEGIKVSGKARLPAGEVLRLQLVDTAGKVLGQRVAAVGETANGYGLFSTEIVYRVNVPTPVRLVVYAVGDPLSPIRFLASSKVELIPVR